MALSTSVVMHFTKNKSSLMGILNSNFNIHYCRERVLLGSHVTNFMVPMVSFCDIPLSEIKDHISKYGGYGIGLTKNWARKSGMNPVLYIEKESFLASSYIDAFKNYVIEGNDRNESHTPEQEKLADVLRYMKNYEGELIRKGKSKGQYRFSDEREWRYVPKHDAECEMLCSSRAYDDDKENIEQSVASLSLKFEPSDIEYIVLKNDSEISSFINKLRKTRTFEPHIDRLASRIITTKQIHNDF